MNGDASVQVGSCHKKVKAILPNPPDEGVQDIPLQKFLQKPDMSSQLVKWAIELSEFNI